ncbi:MAG: hypothetical protein ACRCUP_00235 [Mycoplasmatales bacterium]
MKKFKLNLTIQNRILITSSILILFFASVVYTLQAWDVDNIFSIIGTILLVIILSVNNIERLYPNKLTKHFIGYLHFYGIISFILLIPHTAITGTVTRQIMNFEVSFSTAYLTIPALAFAVLLIMTLTSIQGYQPRWWKKFHRIIWLVIPLTAYHLYLIDYNLLASLFLFPALTAFIGYFKLKTKVFKQQIVMLAISSTITLLGIFFPNFILLLIKLSVILIPILILGYSILQQENAEIKKTLLKYLIIFSIAISFIVVPFLI